jgi:hypothetical protein
MGRNVKTELKKPMHVPIKEQGAWLRSIVMGYFAYHTIPGSWDAFGAFRTQIVRTWYRTIRRRSQKSHITWKHMSNIESKWLPKARILHPWPEQRFASITFTQGKSPVR